MAKRTHLERSCLNSKASGKASGAIKHFDRAASSERVQRRMAPLYSALALDGANSQQPVDDAHCLRLATAAPSVLASPSAKGMPASQNASKCEAFMPVHFDSFGCHAESFPHRAFPEPPPQTPQYPVDAQ